MGTSGFTLHHTNSDSASKWLPPTWAGDIPGLGSVQLHYGPATGRTGHFAQFSVSGNGIPSAEFTGIKFGHAPLPSRAKFQVGTYAGRLSRRRSGLTRDGRALRVRLADREYRYRQGPSKLIHELRRPGTTIRVTRDTWTRPLTLQVTTEGQADVLDICLALLLQGVYTRHLSQGGRWFSMLGRFVNRMPDMA
ncbi:MULTISPECIES: hypothetical protein [unclassified Streptomyces]|nr:MULTISPECIES: hypothetical protein [unclassified Streptomyces]WSA96606.1 hypothetical protein OIE63_37415 [Streptomyces sp. NBC_01795]WSS10769.1 hypothetical protein OG533_01725 [Streptomyces sp. NBC_01186]WSS39468.1 hypothetical protein OG220_01765 [Streptomyces sp. NBC_01187]